MFEDGALGAYRRRLNGVQLAEKWGLVVLAAKSDKRDSFPDGDRGLCAKIQPPNGPDPFPFTHISTVTAA